MFTRLSLVVFLLPLTADSLVCPVYNIFNNDTRTIRSCDTNHSLCAYMTTQSTTRRCLGIYTFENAFQTKELLIRIRQLAMVDDLEDKYSNATHCTLDVDRTGQNLLCRCNSDNCTLTWKTADDVHYRLYLNPNSIRQQELSSWSLPLTITCAVIVSISVIVLIVVSKYHGFGQRREKDDRSFLGNLSAASTNISHAEIDEFLSSNPTYQSVISHGKTSIIYWAWTTGRGNFQHEKKTVAVKVYHGQEYKNIFENEVQILRMVQHSAIINFISHGWHALSPYVLLEYHELGSLNQYLRSQKLSWSTCYSFLLSLVEAIDYLHYEDLSPNIYLAAGRIRKPIILHRDIKSSNILVKSTSALSLCLTDFGLAKILPPILTPKDFIQVGTYRYMAPELLELAISHTSEALCKVDMYALGLVLWEILTQCKEYSDQVDYQPPYAEFVDSSETNENKILDTLYRVVVNDKKRPAIHRTANMTSKIADVCTIVEDCWKHEPESRMNARPALYRLRRLQ